MARLYESQTSTGLTRRLCFGTRVLMKQFLQCLIFHETTIKGQQSQNEMNTNPVYIKITFDLALNVHVSCLPSRPVKRLKRMVDRSIIGCRSGLLRGRYPEGDSVVAFVGVQLFVASPVVRNGPKWMKGRGVTWVACFFQSCWHVTFLFYPVLLLKKKEDSKTSQNEMKQFRLLNYDQTYLEMHDDTWMACANLSLPFGKRPRYLGGLCGIARRHQWWGFQQYLRSGDLERTTVPATQARPVKGWMWRFLKFGNLKFNRSFLKRGSSA